MKFFLIATFLLFFAQHVNAQTEWFTQTIQSNIELQFPKPPQEMDYGENNNWLVFYDSTLFQLSKIKYEEKTKSSYKSCQTMVKGVVDGCNGKLLRSDSAKINGYCALYFTVQPTAAPLENAVIKGFAVDLDGKSYILMATTEKKNLQLVDRFIASFKINK